MRRRSWSGLDRVLYTIAKKKREGAAHSIPNLNDGVLHHHRGVHVLPMDAATPKEPGATKVY